MEHGDWEGLEFKPHERVKRQKIALPHVFSVPAASYQPPPSTLSPSDLGGAKALPGDQGLDEVQAKARGSRLHLLLEHLPNVPTENWDQITQNLLRDAEDRDELMAEALAVIQNPELAAIFAPDTLAEVTVTARLNSERLHGVIDRLIVTPDKVIAVDFKSNATVPTSPAQCPEGVLRQMGAYAHALTQIYPDHQIETAIIWTRTATLMPLPHDLVSEALLRRLMP